MNPTAALSCVWLAASACAQDFEVLSPLQDNGRPAAQQAHASPVWTHEPLRMAINTALAFPAPSNAIARVFEELRSSSFDERTVLLRTLGTNNLSYALLTVTGRDRSLFEIELDAFLFALVAGQRTAFGQSPVRPEDIVEHHILVSEPTEITGHFVVDIPTCLRVRCIYQARQEGDSWQVQRMVIARKNSLRIEDGLQVISENSLPHSRETSK